MMYALSTLRWSCSGRICEPVGRNTQRVNEDIKRMDGDKGLPLYVI